jgi:hypothetical protein
LNPFTIFTVQDSAVNSSITCGSNPRIGARPAQRDVNISRANLCFPQHCGDLVLGHVDIDIDHSRIGRAFGAVLAVDDRPAADRLSLVGAQALAGEHPAAAPVFLQKRNVSSQWNPVSQNILPIRISPPSGMRQLFSMVAPPARYARTGDVMQAEAFAWLRAQLGGKLESVIGSGMGV